MKTRLTLTLAAVGFLAGCATEEAAPSQYAAVADVQTLMLTVLEPAAEVYWDAVGTIIDRDAGTIEIRPQSDEDWEAVRNAAYVIAESGNLLMMEGRAMEEAAWMPMSRAMIDVGRKAIDAADARDEAAVFDAGAEVYQACTNCHATFALETLRPNDTRAN